MEKERNSAIQQIHNSVCHVLGIFAGAEGETVYDKDQDLCLHKAFYLEIWRYIAEETLK